jgi:hypothetical protein
MRSSVYGFRLAGAVRLAGLTALIHCIPTLCEAWRTCRPVMAAMPVVTFIWTAEPASSWRGTSRLLRAVVRGAAASVLRVSNCTQAERRSIANV